jgi:hypothetical protein
MPANVPFEDYAPVCHSAYFFDVKHVHELSLSCDNLKKIMELSLSTKRKKECEGKMLAVSVFEYDAICYFDANSLCAFPRVFS